MLCQKIISEEHTRNITLVNCFRRLRVRSFPLQLEFAVFAALTDGLGRMSLDLTVSRLDTLDDIHSWSWPVTFPDPLSEVRFILIHDPVEAVCLLPPHQGGVQGLGLLLRGFSVFPRRRA